MKPLYIWLEDDLNEMFVSFCTENKSKKAHVVRSALRQFLEANKPEPKEVA